MKNALGGLSKRDVMKLHMALFTYLLGAQRNILFARPLPRSPMGNEHASRSTLATADSIDSRNEYLTEAGRQGNFVFSTDDLSTMVTADPEQGIYIAPAIDTSGKLGAWVRQFDGYIFPNWFGSVGNGPGVDAALAINASLNLAKVVNGPHSHASVFIPPGVHNIFTPIDRTGTGNYINIIGAGVRNTILVARAPMADMLDLAEAGDITGRTLITGITFDCRNNADRAVDAENMRYWTFEKNEIRNAAVEGIKCGNWITQVINNLINGCPIGINIDGIDKSPQAANNLLIERNNMTSCSVGISIERESNDVSIFRNSFDHCEDAGIWAKMGARSLNIESNYFERCGKDLSDINGCGVPLSLLGGEIRNISAPIVIGQNPTAIRGTTWSGLISKNFYANCNSERLIALSNVKAGDIQADRVHERYRGEHYVEILGSGCSSLCKRLSIDVAFGESVFNKLVALNGLDSEDNHQNIHISNSDASGLLLRGGVYWNDPTSDVWTGEGKASIEARFHQGQPEFKLVGNSDIEMNTTLYGPSRLRGRYLRLHGASKGIGGTAGVEIEIFVDGVRILHQAKTSSTYKQFGRGIVCYIPKDATELMLRIRGTSKSIPISVIGFCICDASYPLNAVPYKSA